MFPALVIGSVLFAVGMVGLLARRDAVGRALSAALAVQAIVLTAVAIASADGTGVASGSAVVILLALLLELGALSLIGRTLRDRQRRQLDAAPDAIATSNACPDLVVSGVEASENDQTRHEG